MIDYEKSLAAAKDGSPFSNSSEAEPWLANWCGTCWNDKPAREDDYGNGCPLILIALSHKTPAEWTKQRDADGRERFGDYHCIMYRPEDDGPDPEPQPIPDPPGQITLLPREAYEGTRMLAPLTTPQEAVR